MAADVANQPVTRARRPPVSADPILPVKIAAPGVPGWAVPRPRLTRLLAESIRWHPLTVVTGPPGAGKTMALAMWAAAEPGTVAWVRLDEFDNRPAAFWSCVVAALRRCGVAVAGRLRAAARERPGGEEFLLRLTAALAAQDPPVTLVLDDLHLLAEPRLLKGLDFVLRNVGSGLRIAVSSQLDPLLPLHRYRLAGTMTEIRASDLAFTAAEAGELLARHGTTLAPDSLESLTRRTEGWAAALRLAAISLRAHPDPGQFVKELIAEDRALTGYVVDEVLNVQPPDVREVLLSTSILDNVSADAAVELVGDEHAAESLRALAHASTLIEPVAPGWYRYHTLVAEVLRLKLRHEHPQQVAVLHRRAARWYERNSLFTDAARHAAEAGDWPLAASMAVDGLTIGEFIDPGEGGPLAGVFRGMPPGRAWTAPQPHLVSAAIALSAGQHEPCAAALHAADAMLDRLPADQQAACRLTAAVVRLSLWLRAGDLTAAASAAADAEALLTGIPDGKLTRDTGIGERVTCGRGAIELWSGRLDEAARVLEAAAASGEEPGRADRAGQLALAEALRGRLCRAAELAAGTVGRRLPRGRPADPAALVALALVHVERSELREARGYLRQADAAFGARPDRPLGTVAYLVAACGALAEGRPEAVAQIVARARSGWPAPAWLDQRLSLAESRAYAAAGDIEAAVAAAERAGRAGRVGGGTAPEAAVALAHARAAAGDFETARRSLAPVLAAIGDVPDRVRLHAWLVDARLGYAGGDRARARRSLASALRLAGPEQLRLPFSMERAWIEPVLRHDPELADMHRRLLRPAEAPGRLPAAEAPGRLPAPRPTPDRAPVLVVEALTAREREVLRNVSGLLDTAEIAKEMYISVNTVKSHLKSIYRKLAATGRAEAVRRARQLQLI